MHQPSLSDLPRVDTLVAAADELVARHGRAAVTATVRRVLDETRARLLDGAAEPPTQAGLLADVAADLAARRPGPPRRIVNATGVVLHTNLGRAPLSDAARAAVAGAAGYCDLEYEVSTGARGSRGARLDPLIAEATGAPAATAVNNAAAALVLVLSCLARDRDVVVSRGELVEIGGSFRLPDIMAASGARLLEVGTTNKTRASDFAAASGDIALILSVHPSNFRISGFTESPSLAELADVARDRGVPLVHDVGSGLLADRAEPWLRGEPSMAGSLAAGADLVLCSGDKLLGGPQAGLLAGRADLVDACRRHPLARALRLDKLRIAALVATLESHLRGAMDEVPTWAMLQAAPDALDARAAMMAEQTGGIVTAGTSLVGGGAAPDRSVTGPTVRLDCADPASIAADLRAGDPPIIVRVEDGAVWIDPRTVAPDDDALVVERVRALTARA